MAKVGKSYIVHFQPRELIYSEEFQSVEEQVNKLGLRNGVEISYIQEEGETDENIIRMVNICNTGTRIYLSEYPIYTCMYIWNPLNFIAAVEVLLLSLNWGCKS